MALLACFGLAHISFSYFISFWFSSPEGALKAFSFIYLFGGLFFPMISNTILLATVGCDAYHVAELIT